MYRVLHLSWEYPPKIQGELAFRVKELVKELSRLGLAVTVVYPSLAEAEYVEEGVRVLAAAVSVKSNIHFLTEVFSSTVDLLRVASKHIYECGGVDLIHSHEWSASIAGLLLKELLRKPLIISAYTTETIRGGGSLISHSIKELEKKCFKEASALITHSRKTLNELVNEYGVEEELIELIEYKEVNLVAKEVSKVYEVVLSEGFNA